MTSFEPPVYPSRPDEAPAVAIRPLGGLATALSVLLTGAGAIALIAAFSLFSRAGVMTDAIADEGDAMFRRIEDADSFVILTAIGYVLMVLATGVVFIIWQYQHAGNAQALRGRLGLGPGWAIGGWFIPIANLILPVLQLREAARASDPALPRGDRQTLGQTPGIVTGWAVAYIGAAVVYVVGAQTRNGSLDAFVREDAFSSFASGDRIAGVGMLTYAVAAALAIGMVRTLTVNQQYAARM